MPFTLPDNDEAFNTNQAIWMQTDINALVAGIGGDGVVSGCAVTAQGSPDMTLAVASGTISIAGAAVAVSSGNVTITTADATNPRIDLVVVNNSGTKSVTAGTAAASPKAPDIPANSILLAMVYIPANDTAIQSNQITDKRAITIPTTTFIRTLLDDADAAAARGTLGLANYGRPKAATTGIAYSVPGGAWQSSGTRALAANTAYYGFFYTPVPITIDQMACEVTTLAASSNIRMGIYNADQDFQPTSLVVDAGAVSGGSTGVKAASISDTVLAAGRYVTCLVSDGTPTLRWNGLSDLTCGFQPALGSVAVIALVTVALTYGALAGSGTVWTTHAANAGCMQHHCFVRIKSIP